MISQIWFIIDIICSLNTGYYNQGVIILNRKKILLHYLKTKLLFDFIATIPYEWILLDAMKLKISNYRSSLEVIYFFDILV